VRVAEIPSTKQVSKRSSGELYELIDETSVDSDWLN
jgi:hypothetical protein